MSRRAERQGVVTDQATTHTLHGDDRDGLVVIGRDGHRLGAIGGLLSSTGAPDADFAIVETRWLARRRYAIPLELVRFQDGKARLHVTRDRLDAAPEWHEGDLDFQRFHAYWQPPIAGGSETVSDGDILVGEEITGTTYSGTDLDSATERVANTLRAAHDAGHD